MNQGQAGNRNPSGNTHLGLILESKRCGGTCFADFIFPFVFHPKHLQRLAVRKQSMPFQCHLHRISHSTPFPGIADWIMVELQIQCGCKNSMLCLFCVLSDALLEGLDSNLMLCGHLRWRRHKFEYVHLSACLMKRLSFWGP